MARKEFEKFCVTTIGGLPNNKMGAAGGIDGRIPLEGGLTAICSVKSGQVSVRAVRELKGLLNAKQVAGVLITRHAPTAPMRDFARQAGVVQPAQIGLYQADPYPQNPDPDSGRDPKGATSPTTLRRITQVPAPAPVRIAPGSLCRVILGIEKLSGLTRRQGQWVPEDPGVWLTNVLIVWPGDESGSKLGASHSCPGWDVEVWLQDARPVGGPWRSGRRRWSAGGGDLG